jgi:hypothetical protein
MHSQQFGRRGLWGTALFVAAVFAIVPLAAAQNPQLQQRLADIKKAAAANKQSLARYTWQEQQTISIRGEVRKTELFQVHLGADGKPQKTPLSNGPSSNTGGRRFKRRIEEKIAAEYEQYAQQIEALAQSYAQPDPQRFQQSYDRGNVTLASAGAPGEIRLMITNYMKPNDSVGIVFNQVQKAILSLQISSYLDNPSDAVKISAQFSKLPDGTNHVSSMSVNGVSKQLLIQDQNTNYQKM